MNIYFIFILLIIILILFFFNKYLSKELFSAGYIPPTTPVGSVNDKRTISLYEAQNSIFSNNIDKEWKNWTVGSNSDFVQDLPPPLQEVYLELPNYLKHGDQTNRKGLLSYVDLMKLVTNKTDQSTFGEFEEYLWNPTDRSDLEFKYQLDFELDMLNKKTWIDRWKEYDPLKTKNFPYDQIISPIDNVNKLNFEFLDRCNKQQQNVLTDPQLVQFGIIPFTIYKYAIQKVEYQKDPSIPKDQKLAMYNIKIMFYRESDLYITTLFYKGLVNTNNNQIYIFEAQYIGGTSKDKYLQPNAFTNEPTYTIINKNYTNDQNDKILELDPDNVVKQVKDYEEKYKIKNQYACFNTNPQVYTNPDKVDDYLIMFNHSDRNNTILTKEMCQSSYDWYGRKKEVGILDSPCKKDEDCPFYQQNKNYPNQRGKCGSDGKCELPLNMKNLGYHYFSPIPAYRPLCYNCNADRWNVLTPLDDCCEEQFNKDKYPYLDGPDYAFQNDYTDRYNNFLQKKCYMNSENKLICN